MKSEQTIRNMIRDLRTLLNDTCDCVGCQHSKPAHHVACQCLEWVLDENKGCDERAEVIAQDAANARLHGVRPLPSQ